MIKNIRHIGIPVVNVIDSMNFYMQFGFKTDLATVENWGGGDLIIAKLAAPGIDTQIELVEGDWPHHFAVQVPMNFSAESFKIWKRKQNVTFIEDPSGNLIELVKGEA